MRKNYNCLKCPGYCCSYPAVVVSKRDLERLAEGERKRGLRLENVPYAREQAANGRP